MPDLVYRIPFMAALLRWCRQHQPCAVYSVQSTPVDYSPQPLGCGSRGSSLPQPIPVSRVCTCPFSHKTRANVIIVSYYYGPFFFGPCAGPIRNRPHSVLGPFASDAFSSTWLSLPSFELMTSQQLPGSIRLSRSPL